MLNMIPQGDVIIAINIDGLPLVKSASSQFYLVLGINKSLQSNVFVVGIYHGFAKPNKFEEFLEEFVTEAAHLTSNGISVLGKLYKFKISMFLMDAVAKSSVLCIKGHSGYYSCTKCSQEGEYLINHVCFPSLNFTKRTHEDFITQSNKEHHVGNSILANIPGIDLIKDIPLDYMHLVLLGVVKRMLLGIWISGSPPHKLPGQSINTISEHLVSLAAYIPTEFARKPRSLSEVKRWKATEYRQFLFYTGPIVLKK